MAKEVYGSIVTRSANSWTSITDAYQMRLYIKDTGDVNNDKTQRKLRVTLQGYCYNPGGYQMHWHPRAWIANSSGTRLSDEVNPSDWWPRDQWINLVSYDVWASPGKNTYRGYYKNTNTTNYLPKTGEWYASATLDVEYIGKAPNAPTSLNIPSSIAPDQTASISWSGASGGAAGIGISGYELAYSKDGGNSWAYVDVGNTTSYNLNLNSAGFVHDSILYCAIRSYSTVYGTKYYSGWKYSGKTTTKFVAPSVPSTVNIPSSIAPDKTASISWSSASGGTNGVKGYHWEYSKDGGSNWTNGGTTTSTSISLNLNSAGFGHGSRLAVRVRSYTTGQGANYYSGWKTSGTTTTNFVAPSAPRNVAVGTDMSEPIPTGTYNGTWTAPSSGGTNGVKGYRVQWLKNGNNLGSEYDDGASPASKAVTESDIQPGDKISFKVRAYTIGQNTRYYSGYATSGTITIVSDKFIYISQNGGSFVKYKAFISVNGGSFKEIKKEKLKVIK